MTDVHPGIINQYYGIDGHRRVRRPGETGAGHEDAEEFWVDEDSMPVDDGESSETTEANDDDQEYLQDCIAKDQAKNIRHPAVKVARHKNPFESLAHQEQFFQALDEVRNAYLVPEGYGVLEWEWEDETYPLLETINPGARGKDIIVELPKAIWLPRAILFAQGLDVMSRFTQ
jgi:hypothetical protein